MLDLHTGTHGYREVLPPYMVNEASMFGTGQLPKFKEDLFHCEGERPLDDSDGGGAVNESVPRRNCGRKRAADFCDGVHALLSRRGGRIWEDVRGLIRQHQFQKVELVKFVRPISRMRSMRS